MSDNGFHRISTKRPVICMATIDWHFLFQRHQHLMMRLAEKGHPVYFLNATRIPGTAPEKISPTLWVYSDFSSIPLHVQENAIYFAYHPAFIAGIKQGSQTFIVYDCVDDFPEFEVLEQQALDRSNLILCSSNYLFKRFSTRHPQLMHLPNGVDVSHFQNRTRKLPPQMAKIRATEKPVIGFAGAMYSGWVDINLLYDISRANPQWEVVIIGESYAWDFNNAPPNLSYLGRKSYGRLPQYLAGFDVAIIPFLDNQISRGTDPIKLYEYIAAGLPVVSRRLPFNDDLGPPLVYTYNTADECFSALNQALSETGDHVSAIGSVRRQYAVDNSWENRVDALINKLSELTWLEKINESPVPSPETASFITPDGSRHPMTIRRISQKAGGAQNPSKGNVKKTTRIKSAGNSIR